MTENLMKRLNRLETLVPALIRLTHQQQELIEDLFEQADELDCSLQKLSNKPCCRHSAAFETFVRDYRQ